MPGTGTPLTTRPKLQTVNVASAGTVVEADVPSNAVGFSLRVRSGNGIWATTYSGTGALAEPYSKPGVGGGFSMPDKRNSYADVEDLAPKLYFDSTIGPAVFEIAWF